MTNAVVWFRRDLRLADNHVLAGALAASDAVVPLFVLDPRLWDAAGKNRRWFLAGCLAALDRDLGGTLVVRRGDPARVVPEVAGAVDAARVYRAQDVGPYGRRRDEAVAAALAADGRELVEADSPWAVPAGTLRTTAGTAFKVYSRYADSWRQHGIARTVSRPSDIAAVRGVRSDGLPDAPDVDADLPAPGEEAAHRALERFVRSRVERYDRLRDDPGADATSRLSPYLRFGCLHPRQALRRLDGTNRSHQTFAKELAWRDFYADVLHEWPESAWQTWNPTMRGLRVDDGQQADTRFEAWCAGRTGFPIVDAGMRQLVAQGWMHNRVRMIVASFLVKDLHLDWTRGARFFMHHLVDGDLPSNNHGWQWTAGTGTDAAPYYRVFNPVRQSEKFDADGTYIRRWVAELADVEAPHVHEPHTAPGGPPNGYPEPIVDHATERQEALARYQDTKR